MAKRILSSSVNWSLLGEAVPAHLEPKAFQAFKTKSDKFLRRLAENPADLPKIDWDFYKSKIAKPGLVEGFQKSYEGIKIPYPGDQGHLAKLDEKLATQKKNHAEFVVSIKKEIEELKVKLKKLEQEIPYSEMTQEEYMMALPQTKDVVYKPKFVGKYDE